MEKVVVASGYFSPCHVGHLDYLEAAAKLGGHLIVIVNNDKQAILKKGYSFMPEHERLRIVEALRPVNEVYLSIDKDPSVSKTIKLLSCKYGIDIFVNGGDVNETCLEVDICKRLGIRMVFGVGGSIKTQSSSTLIHNSHRCINKHHPSY